MHNSANRDRERQLREAKEAELRAAKAAKEARDQRKHRQFETPQVGPRSQDLDSRIKKNAVLQSHQPKQLSRQDIFDRQRMGGQEDEEENYSYKPVPKTAAFYQEEISGSKGRPW